MSDRSLIVRIIGDSSSLERSFARSSKATRQFDRDFSRASRGVLAGSGVFRAAGRSLAFASGGFLAFASGAQFLRSSVDAAKEAQVANKQLATQLANSGKSFEAYRAQIDRTIFRLSALAGIEDDELKQGLTTILRTVPDVSKALDDLALAADLARARHISLSQAAVIVAKTEAGNTTLLRRQGFQIAKNATAEQALAKVRQVVAGQAEAGTTAQERFGAVLHQTEEIIGTGILPTLNKYLISGTKWLEQMNESGKLQKDVAKAASDFAAAIHGVADVVKTVDKITGSFKNTLKLLLEIKVASTLIRWAAAMNLFAAAEVAANESAVVSRVTAYTGAVTGTGVAAETSAGKVNKLKGALGGLNLVSIAPILIPIEISIGEKERAFLNQLGKLGAVPKALLDIATAGGAVTGGNVITDLTGLGGTKTKEDLSLSATKGLGPHHTAAVEKQIKDAIDAAKKVVSKQGLTAEQKNTFFDNAIARILLRSGLGTIQQQITGLEAADRLIEQRLKVTKDVTRRLNLEDELLQNRAQIKSLRAQQTADVLQAQADAKQKAIDALAAQAAARTARQFRELGLTATGDEPVPGVKSLKKRLAQLTANVTASSLNTPKLRSELARFRKVLAEGLVGPDVRLKIKEMMDQIASDLKNATGDISKNLTKWRHASAEQVIAGISGLTAEQKRILEARIATIGPGGTVPGTRSLAFSAAGAGVGDVFLDGEKVGIVTTSHQIKRSKKRTIPRAG